MNPLMSLDYYHWAIVILTLLALFALLAISRGSASWKFSHMLMTKKDGADVADRQAFVLLGSFFVSTVWGTVMVLQKAMTEWFFIGYMVAWGGSHFGSRWLKMKGGRGDAQ